MATKKTRAAKPGTMQVTVPPGVGTDAEIAAGCAKHLPGWDGLSDKGKADAVRLARWVQEHDVVPVMQCDADGPKKGLLRAADGSNPTLFYLRVAELLGSPSAEHMNQRTQDITRYVNRTGSDNSGQAVSAMLAFVKGVEAQDTAQSALAVQMAATHDAAMYALGQMRGSQYAEQAKMFGTIGAKLLNAYTRQAEVLTKMQRGGEQVVRHVHTYIDNRNGQAIIAETVTTGGQGPTSKSGYQRDETTGTEAIGLCASMSGPQPFGQPMPVSSGEGQEALPHARRGSRVRRAQGQ